MSEKTLKCLKIIFVLLIPILAILMCAVQGHHIFEIYLPTGWCSDEVSYYKQIEAIIEYGMPKGYWGYNESTAQFGTFGPWTVTCFFPYIFVGKIIGWNFATPIICNLIFLVVGAYIYTKLYPDNTGFLYLMGLEISMAWLSRYAISGMLEPFVISLELILLGLMRTNTVTNKKKIFWIYIVVYILTLMRPYFIVLFFLPYLFGNKKKKELFIVSTVITILAAIQYLVSRKLFCAAYASSSIFDNGFNIKEIIKAGFRALQTIFRLLCNGGATYGYAYALMICIIVFYFGSIIRKIRADKKLDIILVTRLYVLSSVFIVLGAIIFLYEPYAGSRHAWQITMFAMMMFVTDNKNSRKIRRMLIVANIIIFIVYLRDSAYLQSIPYKCNAGDKIEVGEELKELFVLQEERWDNTIAINASCVDYNYAYYLPSYMGIQLVWDEWLQGEIGDINSRYLFTGTNSDLYEICINNGWIILWENKEGNICILEHLHAQNEKMLTRGDI